MNTETILTVGVNEDKTWTFICSGYDLTNNNLYAQIRDETDDLKGNCSVSISSSSSFKVSVTKIVTASLTPGDYYMDILATSTETGKNTYISAVIKLQVQYRVTRP